MLSASFDGEAMSMPKTLGKREAPLSLSLSLAVVKERRCWCPADEYLPIRRAQIFFGIRRVNREEANLLEMPVLRSLMPLHAAQV